jgi:hypothetical protein
MVFLLHRSLVLGSAGVAKEEQEESVFHQMQVAGEMLCPQCWAPSQHMVFFYDCDKHMRCFGAGIFVVGALRSFGAGRGTLACASELLARR